MDFSKWKQKAKDLWNKVVELKDKTLDYTAQKVSESGLVIKDQTDLEKLVLSSANKTFTTKDGEEKISIKRSLLVLGDSNDKFYREFLWSIPVLVTKSFTQNMKLKLLDTNNIAVNIAKYKVKQTPALLVFENKKVYKTILGEDNIKKVVKTLSLDINKSIEDID